MTYTYDGAGVPNSKGRLTSVGSSVSTTNYTAYDVSGQITGSNQVTDNVTYAMSYGYDRAGNLTAQTYPSGRVVTTAYDGVGRMRGVTGNYGGVQRTYATVGSPDGYTPHGALQKLQLGNGLWETAALNSRLQPTMMGLGTSVTDTSLLRLEYGYGSTDNNGSVRSQAIIAPGLGITQSYTYNALNHLETAQEMSGGSLAWKQRFTYDRFGNRNYDTTQTQMPAGMNIVNATFAPTGNQYAANQGYGYDLAGNTTQASGGQSYAYDAENRLKSYNNGAATYAYDGNGNRVKKVAGSVATIFVYDIKGSLVAEYTNDTPTSGGTSFYMDDALRSTRVVTDANGQVKARHDYLPFGEELSAGTGGRTLTQKYVIDDVRQKFTGKERDAETGLDYFLARYYSSAQGRFTSPDEFTGGPDVFYDFADLASDNPTFYADLLNPQSLNKYQYCLNNPLQYVDPDGHQVAIPSPFGPIPLPLPPRASPEQMLRDAQRAEADLKRLGRAVGETISESARDTASIISTVATVGYFMVSSAVNSLTEDNAGDKQKVGQGSTGSAGTYAPRDTKTGEPIPLPRDARTGNPVPESKNPHTQIGTRTSKRTGERYTQARQFGRGGKHKKDIDFTNHRRKNHTNPHQHRIDPKTGKRLPI